jgi:transcriptional regulator with XRE-family HTH domain
VAEGDLQRTLGENLRSHRLRLGRSQEQLSEDLGVHRTYVGSIERGERNLSLQSVERLAEALGVETLELLTPRRGGK